MPFLSFLFCAFLWCAPLSGFALAASTPASVVPAIQQAIDSSDMVSFERHVDMNSVLDQGSTAVILALQQAKQAPAHLPPMLTLMVASVQDPTMAAQIKKLLQQETDSFVRYGVTSGAFAGKPQANNSGPNGLIAPLMRDASTGRKTLTLRGEPRHLNSNWIVPVQIHDDGNGKNYAVDFRVREVGGIWKVFEIANIDKLVQRIQKESNE